METSGTGNNVRCFWRESSPYHQADPELKSIPVIVVTSYALSGDDSKANAAGCDAYVTKPYSPRQLLAKIREFLP